MSPDWPDYACAIIPAPDPGRIWLEERPATARFAPGLWTCFGGRRERGETPEQCLRRELDEELNWAPRTMAKQVELWVEGQPIAWFFLVEPAPSATELQPRGSPARDVALGDLARQPVSPWHRAVLLAWQAGRERVDYSPGDPLQAVPS
ncbi:MAG: NUDIX hydrolase [Planctomycetaceae bacterium]